MRQLTEDAKTPGHVAVPSREGGGRHIEKYVWGFAPTSNDLPWILPVGLSVSVRASRVPARPTTSAYLQRHVRTSTTTAGEVASSCDARDPASALKMLSSALREMMLPSVNRTRSLIVRAAVPRASRVLCDCRSRFVFMLQDLEMFVLPHGANSALGDECVDADGRSAIAAQRRGTEYATR